MFHLEISRVNVWKKTLFFSARSTSAKLWVKSIDHAAIKSTGSQTNQSILLNRSKREWMVRHFKDRNTSTEESIKMSCDTAQESDSFHYWNIKMLFQIFSIQFGCILYCFIVQQRPLLFDLKLININKTLRGFSIFHQNPPSELKSNQNIRVTKP